MKFKKELKIQDLVEFAGPLIDEVMGPIDGDLIYFSSPDAGKNKSFSFINSNKLVSLAEQSEATCILAPSSVRPTVEKLNSKKTWLFSRNTELCARNIKQEFVLATPFRADFNGVHSTAVVHPSVTLDPTVTVGPFAVINEDCKIGKGSYIGSHSVIERDCIIKDQVTIHPHVYVGHNSEIGHRCEVMPQAILASEGFGYAHDHLGNHYRIPHSGRLILHDDVHIGAGTAIDRGTINDSIIGEGTKIDNQCHLAHNTVVGKNGLLTAQLVTAGSSTIGDNFMCGGKTAVTGHINVTDNVHVAGFSAITKDVTKSGQYGGHPLLPLKDALRVKASTTHLPELRKQMKRVLKKLFPEEQ